MDAGAPAAAARSGRAEARGGGPRPARDRGAALTERVWTALPAALGRALRTDVPATAEEIIAAIREAVPAYARPLEGAFARALRTGVERALLDFLDDVEGVPRESAASSGEIYAELGRGEAREGRTIEALLSAYRVGARVAWRRAWAAGRDAGFDADTLARLAEAFFAYIDELSARSAAGFAEEQSAVAGETARRRRALLGVLLRQPPADPAAIEAAAREARWELPATLAALVWREDGARAVARRLPLGSLVGTLDDGLECALVPDAGAPGRRREIERALGDGRRAALGPVVAAAEAWRSARRARELHRLFADGLLDGGLATAHDHLADLVVHGDRDLAGELAARALAPLTDRTPVTRERLVETLAAWLDHQGNVPRAAAALHVHPQTVRYRLRQLRELFGERLDDPAARFELMLAVRADPRPPAVGGRGAAARAGPAPRPRRVSP